MLKSYYQNSTLALCWLFHFKKMCRWRKHKNTIRKKTWVEYDHKVSSAFSFNILNDGEETVKRKRKHFFFVWKNIRYIYVVIWHWYVKVEAVLKVIYIGTDLLFKNLYICDISPEDRSLPKGLRVEWSGPFPIGINPSPHKTSQSFFPPSCTFATFFHANRAVV